MGKIAPGVFKKTPWVFFFEGAPPWVFAPWGFLRPSFTLVRTQLELRRLEHRLVIRRRRTRHLRRLSRPVYTQSQRRAVFYLLPDDPGARPAGRIAAGTPGEAAAEATDRAGRP